MLRYVHTVRMYTYLHTTHNQMNIARRNNRIEIKRAESRDQEIQNSTFHKIAHEYTLPVTKGTLIRSRQIMLTELTLPISYGKNDPYQPKMKSELKPRCLCYSIFNVSR